ncbi:hypothetical protein [Streptomyces chattanoogensis]|uniref:hypothetical protein n=1 Tax=Streptomyces chattanoogensis TaxID=66876 RepID=UPI0006B41405|nr:hypothetical protein [Streptomyces chattanoogensis]
MQVEEVRRLLADRLGGGPRPPSPEAAREAIARLARPDTLGPLVRRLSAGDHDLAGCTRLSYRHVLGFDKLLLLGGAPRYMLRVHFWHGGTAPAPEDIHNHRCAIASAVVRGRVRMECYEPVADERVTDAAPRTAAPGTAAPGAGVPAIAYRETIDGPGGAWRLRRVGEARLRLVRDERYAAGSSYGLDARALHRVVSEEPTVTLFLETAAQRTVTDVYVRTDAPVRNGGGAGRPDPPPKTPLPPAAYLAELDALARSLGC